MIKKKKRIIWITIGTFLVLIAFLTNTYLLNQRLTQLTEWYVMKNNRQMASQISQRINRGKEFITEFCDSLGRMPDFLLTEELLNRKAKVMGLEELFVISKDDQFFPASAETASISQWIKENQQIWDEPVISYVKDENIIFSAPVLHEGKSEQVIIALQNYKDIKSLVNSTDYQDEAVSVLIDLENRQKIISEYGSGVSLSESEIDNLLKEFKKIDGQQDIFKEIEGVLISSCKVADTSWKQIVIVPYEFLTFKIEKCVKIYIGLFIVMVILFSLIVFYLKKENEKKEKVYIMDPLTDGYNREGFLKLANEYISLNEKCLYTVVYLNVNDFKNINYIWGEATGNKILGSIYNVLSENIEKKELTCRSSIDHFFLLLDEEKEQAILNRINNITNKVKEFIKNEYTGCTIDFSIGACTIVNNKQIATAMNNAIYASTMGEAKNMCIFYTKEIEEKIDRENRVNDLFEESIKNHDFEIYLQPKVFLSQKGVCEAEALVRWRHPEEGVIFPDQFIPVFEKKGKICELDLYVFEEVCRLISGWIEANEPLIGVSVNISRYHLKKEGIEICKKYKDIKDKYHIPDGVIEMELTETDMIDKNNIDFVNEVINRFHSCGMKVALDDFGFAYSSLGLLNKLEIDTIKLDRSFFIGINEKSYNIISHLIQLAHCLNISVVAEGIEHTEQVMTLRRLNCDLIQGYVYSKPLPVDEFEKWRYEYEE